MRKTIQRTLGKAILQASVSFKVVLLTGPRQVGKTTLLQEVQKLSRSYVTLDDLNMRRVAQQDPASFLDRQELPVLIDPGAELSSRLREVALQGGFDGLHLVPDGAQDLRLLAPVPVGLR
ncbi:MAG: AAA family ATPase, partial [Nitrospira sp.]|nr:AAA family ATPase [Nitrospira sp.]